MVVFLVNNGGIFSSSSSFKKITNSDRNSAQYTSKILFTAMVKVCSFFMDCSGQVLDDLTRAICSCGD